MQILEYPFIWEWCRQYGVLEEGSSNEAPRLLDNPDLTHRSRVVFAPTGSLGHESRVAAAILDVLGEWDQSLVWVTGWGVWPSSEDWPAYYAFRAQHGQRLSIDDAPGHLVDPAEPSAFRELLLHVLESGWDAAILIAAGGRLSDRRIIISHDGWVALHAGRPLDLNVAGLMTEAG